MLFATFAVRVHWWPMVSWLSTETPWSSSTNLLSSWPAFSVYWCLEFFLHRCRTLQLPLLKIVKFLSAQVFLCQECFTHDMPRPFACKSWYGVFILVNKQRQLFAAFSNPDILAVNCNLNTLEFFYVVLLTKVIDSEGGIQPSFEPCSKKEAFLISCLFWISSWPTPAVDAD